MRTCTHLFSPEMPPLLLIYVSTSISSSQLDIIVWGNSLTRIDYISNAMFDDSLVGAHTNERMYRSSEP